MTFLGGKLRQVVMVAVAIGALAADSPALSAQTAGHVNDAQVEWIRDRAIPFDSAPPAGNLADLDPVVDVVGDARVVALGEATHGTAEFFRMKHRLVRLLARDAGFTVFAIEANIPEARRLNDYVLHGTGSAREALQGLYFWMWNTREILDLIEWMREFNASGQGRIEFWGFDAQTPDVAMDSVRSFVYRADPAFMSTLDLLYDSIDRILESGGGGAGTESAAVWRRAASSVVEHLERNRGVYIEREPKTDVLWALRYAHVVLQSVAMRYGDGARDSIMAENVEWILDEGAPGAKVVLWAHNAHVSRAGGRMGAHLGRRIGDALRVFGFTMYRGEYTARGPRGPGSYPAAPAAPGSIEHTLHRTGLSRFILDLRQAAAAEGGRWLLEPRDMRQIGSVATDGGFHRQSIGKSYDALIYFDRTTPSALLGVP